MTHKFIDLLDGSRADIITNADGTARLVLHGGKWTAQYDHTYGKESSARSVLTKKLCMPIKYTMNEAERDIAFNRMYLFVRDYDSHTYTMPHVFRLLIDDLIECGYDVDMIDDTHRDYKAFRVDGYTFCLLRKKGFSSYQICR